MQHDDQIAAFDDGNVMTTVPPVCCKLQELRVTVGGKPDWMVQVHSRLQRLFGIRRHERRWRTGDTVAPVADEFERPLKVLAARVQGNQEIGRTATVRQAHEILTAKMTAQECWIVSADNCPDRP